MNSPSSPPGWRSRWAQRIVSGRYAVFAIVALLTVILGMQLSHLRFEESESSYFAPDDARLLAVKRFERTFGNDDSVVVLVENKNVFDSALLGRVKALAVALEKGTPYMREVTWLGSAEVMSAEGETLHVGPLFKDIPSTPEDLAKLRTRALGDEALAGRFVSNDGTLTAIVVELKAYPGDRELQRKEVGPAVGKIVAQFPDLKVHLIGGPVLGEAFDKLVGEEIGRFGLIGLVLFGVMLLVLLRSVKAALIPLVVMTLSVVWTFALAAVFDWPMTGLAAMLPTLLVSIGICDSVHVIADYQQELEGGTPHPNAVVRSLERVAVPIMLTTLTNVAAFLAFGGAPLKPINQLGVLAAVGIVLAAGLSLVLAPAMLATGRPLRKARTVQQREGRLERVLQRIVGFAMARPLAVALAFLAVAVLAVSAAHSVEPQTKTVESFPRGAPLRLSYELMDERMKGAMAVEIVLTAPKPEGVRDLDFLRRMAALQARVETHPLVTETRSLADVVARTNQALHGDAPAWHKLPDSAAQAAEYLFLYETSGGRSLERLMSFDGSQARMTVRTRSIDSRDLRNLEAFIDREAAATLAPDTRVEAAGTFALVVALCDLIVQGEMLSFGLALAAVAVLLLAILRSVRLSLIALVPNVLPVVFAFGLMGLLGIPLHLPLMMLAPVVIGVAVDDNVHFFAHFNRHLRELGDQAAALRATVRHIGRALLFNSSVLFIGFGAFVFSQSTDLAEFGLVSAFAFFCALVCDLLLVPALLTLFPPRVPVEQVPSNVQAQS
ncbi:efflux RND transporter permease subunit [Variovorax boronicumulans]|uniref:efflux RND transporter permease subunit n=1 Tax=Variovorax boronicumulans TaxID=436515 RepID=UPI003393867F